MEKVFDELLQETKSLCIALDKDNFWNDPAFVDGFVIIFCHICHSWEIDPNVTNKWGPTGPKEPNKKLVPISKRDHF